MKKFLGSLLVSAVLLSGCELTILGNSAETGEVAPLDSRLITLTDVENTSQIAAIVEPAIVGISGITNAGESVGSGVCVSKNGYILTNSHVISDANKIVLYLSNKSVSNAEVVYDNPVLDLAILKSDKNLPYLKLGRSDELLVGEDVLAVGTPLSLSLTHTFTKGIVSALNRTLKVGSNAGEGYMQNLIQHDASLNPGNSGGPLLNSKGEVVGINTLKISGGEGIGFAIPSKSFESLLGSYVQNINYSIPYLGIYGYDSEIANYYDRRYSENGFFVIDVDNSSPLIECGITPNSVITKFNNVEIKNTLDLKNELYKFSSNDAVSIEFISNGRIYKTKIKLSAKS